MTVGFVDPGSATRPATSSADRPSRAHRSLRVLFLGLVLYAAFGKGFAYAGWPPVFVGEVLLVAVLVASVRPLAAIPRHGPALITLALGALALVQFAVDRLGGATPWLETVRGLAPVYYAAFAFALYALLRAEEHRVGRPALMSSIERAMVRAAPFVLGAVVVLTLKVLFEPGGLPTWPVSGVPLLYTKSNDISVTLVLILPPLLARKVGDRFTPRSWMLLGTWSAAVLLSAFRSRGGMIALVVGLLMMRPRPVRIVKVMMAVGAVVLVLYVTGLSVRVGSREMSYDTVGDVVGSVIGGRPDDQIEGNYVATTTWRAEWWGDIWHDVTSERMIVHGQGWGDNLAVRYGVVPARDADDPQVLRLPHNIFFSLAGRAGLVVAGAFLLVPLLTIARSFRLREDEKEPSMAVLAARGALAAAITTGLADIFLESPQGGILLWNLIGFLWWASAPSAAVADDDGQAVRQRGRLRPSGRDLSLQTDRRGARASAGGGGQIA